MTVNQQDTGPDLDKLRTALESGDPYDQLAALDEIALTWKARAVDLVPLIATLMTSEGYVPRTQRTYEFSGHAEICFHAMSTIRAIGIAPDLETMRTLLADERVFLLPEASYDQGAYIGDYGRVFIAPAGLAAQLVELIGADGFALSPMLAANAGHKADQIAYPAQRAMRELAKILSHASPEQYAGFAAVIDVMSSLPEAIQPTTMRGFEQRDLVDFCRKKLAVGL